MDMYEARRTAQCINIFEVNQFFLLLATDHFSLDGKSQKLNLKGKAALRLIKAALDYCGIPRMGDEVKIHFGGKVTDYVDIS